MTHSDCNISLSLTNPSSVYSCTTPVHAVLHGGMAHLITQNTGTVSRKNMLWIHLDPHLDPHEQTLSTLTAVMPLVAIVVCHHSDNTAALDHWQPAYFPNKKKLSQDNQSLSVTPGCLLGLDEKLKEQLECLKRI